MTITAYRMSHKLVELEEKVSLVKEEELVNVVTNSMKEMWKEERSRGRRGKSKGRGRGRSDEKDDEKKEIVC